jgi:hypothetical protein
MKVFVSSLISGMEFVRAAAREAITTLRHEPIMAEDFGAQPRSPQVACLSGIRQSDLVILILGEHYGAIQSSGLSATHEEYREAKGRKPVISFVQDGVTRDPQQAEFVREVQGWEGGLFRGGFTSPSDLKISLTRALHDFELANAVGPVDEQELVKRAVALMPSERRGYSSGTASLNLVVVGGPRQSILRPIEIEQPTLADALHKTALFGDQRLFDVSEGVQRTIEGDSLVLVQDKTHSKIQLNEQGSVLITLPLRSAGRGMPELIEERVQEQLANALDYATWTLDHVDPTQRLTHIVIAASLTDANHMGWRTQRESDASPNQISISAVTQEKRSTVRVSRTRAALRLDSAHVVEDLIVPLRRQSR